MRRFPRFLQLGAQRPSGAARFAASAPAERAECHFEGRVIHGSTRRSGKNRFTILLSSWPLSSGVSARSTFLVFEVERSPSSWQTLVTVAEQLFPRIKHRRSLFASPLPPRRPISRVRLFKQFHRSSIATCFSFKSARDCDQGMEVEVGY